MVRSQIFEYEGKEYDYVFSIDISDTGAPLILLLSV